jgi:hypothetical protein
MKVLSTFNVSQFPNVTEGSQASSDCPAAKISIQHQMSLEELSVFGGKSTAESLRPPPTALGLSKSA